jgi:putative DNA primase/helicase
MPQKSDRRAEVLERLDIAAFYAGELPGLKPGSGDEALALCPFHEDRNPSLSVNLVTGLFNCFGCDAKGDVFDFYKKRRGLDFKAALAELAIRAGVELGGKGDTSGYQSLSIKEFALAKKLPLEFLKAQGVQEYRFPDGAVATDFHYLDEKGGLKAVRHRFANKGDKKFRWRKGDKVFLYGLWKLEKIRAAGWCLLVEGETDPLTCWKHGLPALGLPGKKTWKRCRAGVDLTGVQVFLWQEPDALDLPAEVAMDLPGLKVIPAPAEFKDLSEAHCQGRDIPALVEALKKKAKGAPPPPAAEAKGLTLDDLGNARRLVAQHGADLRYCYLSKKWHVWDGQRWRVDNTAEVERRAKQVIGALYQEAADCADYNRREALVKFALKTGDSKRIIAMVRQAQSEPGIPVLPGELDANPWLFNCANGTIDLRTGELRPHAREDLLSRMAPVAYDPEAGCDRWEKFLYQIQNVKQTPEAADNVVNFLQRVLGYTLSGSTKEQCLFILWGGGANGKSTLVNVVREILGDYALVTPTETMLAKTKGGEIPADVARLDGPRFVTASEVDRGRRLAESLVKELTGRDTVSARFLYGEYFDFSPQFKLFLCTNNKPVIRGADHAIWRRIKMIPFNVQFGDEEGQEPEDKDLPEKLEAEAPGVLAWLVRGCLAWQAEGLETPAEVCAAGAEYRAEMDVLGEFIDDQCLVGLGYSATAGDLYKAYGEWAEAAGMKEREQLKQRTFGICLSERGFKRDKGAGGVRLWRGVGLRSV